MAQDARLHSSFSYHADAIAYMSHTQKNQLQNEFDRRISFVDQALSTLNPIIFDLETICHNLSDLHPAQGAQSLSETKPTLDALAHILSFSPEAFLSDLLMKTKLSVPNSSSSLPNVMDISRYLKLSLPLLPRSRVVVAHVPIARRVFLQTEQDSHPLSDQEIPESLLFPDMLYSQAFFHSGSLWRLKIFPYGYSSARTTSTNASSNASTSSYTNSSQTSSNSPSTTTSVAASRVTPVISAGADSSEYISVFLERCNATGAREYEKELQRIARGENNLTIKPDEEMSESLSTSMAAHVSHARANVDERSLLSRGAVLDALLTGSLCSELLRRYLSETVIAAHEERRDVNAEAPGQEASSMPSGSSKLSTDVTTSLACTFSLSMLRVDDRGEPVKYCRGSLRQFIGNILDVTGETLDQETEEEEDEDENPQVSHTMQSACASNFSTLHADNVNDSSAQPVKISVNRRRRIFSGSAQCTCSQLSCLRGRGDPVSDVICSILSENRHISAASTALETPPPENTDIMDENRYLSIARILATHKFPEFNELGNSRNQENEHTLLILLQLRQCPLAWCCRRVVCSLRCLHLSYLCPQHTRLQHRQRQHQLR